MSDYRLTLAGNDFVLTFYHFEEYISNLTEFQIVLVISLNYYILMKDLGAKTKKLFFNIYLKISKLRWKIIPIIILLIGVVIFFYSQTGSVPTYQDTCQNASAYTKFSCYQKYFSTLVYEQGANKALAALDSLQQSDSYIADTCHELTHIIGQKAFLVYGSVTEATKYGNSMCYNGYYHGVMESYMSKFDDTKLLNMMPSICKIDPSGKFTQSYYDCVHGLGHGVTIRFNNDIFKALPFCDVLSGNWEKSACYNGVFMQNIAVDNVAHKSLDLKEDDPLYPCDVVLENQKDSCYLNQTSHILQVENYDVAKSFAICDTIQSNYIKTCYQSMGRDISGLAQGIPSKIVEMCSKGNPKYQGECFAGAAGDAVYRNQNPADADALCSLTPNTYKKFCELGKQAAAALQ